MAQQIIGIGTTANDDTGDTLRAAGEKINDNFTELYGVGLVGLSPSNDDILQRKAGAWTNRTLAQLRADLGAPLVIQSGAAVVHTGSTSNTTLATIAIPANAMGPNGSIEITHLSSWTDNANSKTFQVRLGGTIITNTAVSTTASGQHFARIFNANATGSQKFWQSSIGFGNISATPGAAAIDTTAASNLTITVTLADAADTFTLEGFIVKVFYGA